MGCSLQFSLLQYSTPACPIGPYVDGNLEPYRLRRWRIGVPPDNAAFFYTCARPGRSGGRKEGVSDGVVSVWVRGLPGPDTAIVSLLGRKRGPWGLSEFSFYSFYGEDDSPSECGNQPSFQEWIDQRHPDIPILVREHPTYDLRAIGPDTLADIAADILDLIAAGRTVVVVDSGGQERTGAVCRYMKAVEDSRSTPNAERRPQ